MKLYYDLLTVVPYVVHRPGMMWYVRRKQIKEKPFNYKVLQPLNKEKSQMSLAEVYEQGYYQAGTGYLRYSI